MLANAARYTNVAQSSRPFPFGAKYDEMNDFKGGNNIPPIVIAIIIDANTQPVGKPPGGFIERRVGTHIKTNVYIAPSLNAWVIPILHICEFERVALHPSVN